MADETSPQGVGGPFLNAATFCERALEEKDGAHSIIRMVDRYWYEKPKDMPPDQRVGIDTFLVIVIKSGDFVGTKTLSVKFRKPSGSYTAGGLNAPLTLNGGQHGVTVQIALRVSVEEDGLYWTDVALDGQLLTRVPLRVEKRSTTEPPSADVV